ncbi:glycosyltransferase [uncultured Ruminococcus sp.]|uniref:glycosyltransferase family 2 protein n=1 Tax=uncultured Ruminococcus sp. TaxID=165186 RepID=UPI0026003100|nr:glycosyltransferase [uncultured Ruminococcus sp.]
MNDAKISIIVPVYNIEKYLEKSIESLINQTYKNIEIILIDDGSTDNSPQICDSLAKKDSRIKVIHQPNKGVSAARNAGIQIADGDYIGFCDGDDTADEDMFEFLYNIAVSDNADIAMCDVRIVFENGEVRDTTTGEHKIWNDTESFLADFLKGSVNMATYTKLFRADICSDVRFPENRKTNEDKFYCFSAALNAEKFSIKSEPKYTYYRRAGSSSITEFSEKYFDCVYLADKISEITKETHPALSENADCNKLITVLRIYKLMYMRNGLDKFRSKADELVNYVKSFDRKIAKKYLSKKDLIRFFTLRTSKPLFFFMIKYFDKY